MSVTMQKCVLCTCTSGFSDLVSTSVLRRSFSHSVLALVSLAYSASASALSEGVLQLGHGIQEMPWFSPEMASEQKSTFHLAPWSSSRSGPLSPLSKGTLPVV